MKTETDLSKRVSSGTPHNPKSEELYRLISTVDFELGGDSFVFKKGGDGDNGEQLMYLLDIIFDAEDNYEMIELYELLKLRKT